MPAEPSSASASARAKAPVAVEVPERPAKPRPVTGPPADWWKKCVTRAAANEPRQAVAAELGQTLPARTWRRLQQVVKRATGPRGEPIESLQSAVAELGTSRDQRATELLVTLLSSENRLHQQLAAKALGDLRDPAAGVPLMQVIDESPEVMAAVFASLSKIADARWTDALLMRGRYRSDQLIACDQAIVDTGRPAVRDLARHLDSADETLLMRVISILGRIADKSAVARLLPLLEHEHPGIRSLVIRSLGQIGDSAAAESIADRLTDPDRHVRHRAAAALVPMAQPVLMPKLVAALGSDVDEVRERMAFALGELGRRESTKALLAHLDDPSPRVRVSVVDALGKIGDPRACDVLLSQIDSSDELIRERAVVALRSQRTAPVHERLLLLLDDANPAVRARAVEALVDPGKPGLIDRMLEMMTTERNPEVRSALIGALGQMKARKAIPVLENALNDSPEIQGDAIQALGEIGDASALPSLLAMLKSTRAMVRYHAAQALGRLGHKNALAPLAELLADDDSLVRHGCAKALIELGDPRGAGLLELARQPYRPRASWNKLSKLRIGSGDGEIPLRKLAMAMLVTVATLGGFGVAARSLMNAQERSVVRGRMTSLAFADDGKTIAVGRNMGGLIELWDVAGSRLLRRETFSEGSVDAVSMVTGSKRVLAFSGKSAQVFDQGQKQDAPGHPNGIRFCAATPDGKLAATCGTDGSVYIWDLATCEITQTLRVPAKDLSAFAVSPNGKLVASGHGDGSVTVWEGSPLTSVAEFKTDTRISAMAFVENSTRLVVADQKRGLTVLDPSGKSAPMPLKNEGKGPSIYIQLFELPDGRLLALEAGRGEIWNIQNATSEQIDSLGGKVDVAAISTDGSMLAMGDREESAVWILDMNTRQVSTRLDMP
jgi:HEAT repeat protein